MYISKIDSNSSDSDVEVQIEKSNDGIEIQSPSFRIKLKSTDDQDINFSTKEIEDYFSNFEDGLTTQDELDDHVIESCVYIYKVP